MKTTTITYHGRPCKKGHTLRYTGGTCIACHKELITKTYNKNKRRETLLQSHYGLTSVEYYEWMADQNWQCAICGATEPGGNGHHFAVDHDHETGQVRGLLCNSCNIGLGCFGDSPKRLSDAIDYLTL